MTIKRPIPKFIALLLLTVAVSFFAIHADGLLLAKMDSMSAADYVEAQRKTYHHSFLHHYVVDFIVGGLFLAIIEFVAYVVGLFFKKSHVK